MLLAALGVLIALSVVSQVYWGQVDPSRAYYATDARLFQLLAGAAMAVATPGHLPPRPDRTSSVTLMPRALAVSGPERRGG